MDWSIPADLSFVDRNNDGRTDRVYAADVGGNIWRADINDANPSNWSVNKLAALGCDTDTGVCAAGSTPRKFFFPPSVISVGATGAKGSFDAVLLDAPCSATGTIRRHPDLPFIKDGSELAGLVALQADLLDHHLSADPYRAVLRYVPR